MFLDLKCEEDIDIAKRFNNIEASIKFALRNTE